MGDLVDPAAKAARPGTIIEWLHPALRLDGEDIATVDGDAGVAMAKLIYASNMSLDGCTEDARGAFDCRHRDM